MRIGFIGLGGMGGPMTGHLLAAGHELQVWSRRPASADFLPPEVARGLDFVDAPVSGGTAGPVMQQLGVLMAAGWGAQDTSRLLCILERGAGR